VHSIRSSVVSEDGAMRHIPSAWNHDVVAVAIAEVAPIAEELAGAVMDEEQLVAVLVADETIHGAARFPVPDPHVAIVEERRRVPRRIAFRGSRLRS
jgi:hypothetical protein